MGHWGRCGFGAAIMVAVVVAAGCGPSHHSGRASTTSPSLAAPTLSGRAAAEQHALEAYRGMWAAYAKAGLTANPDEPDLGKYATDDALTRLTSGLVDLRKAGHIIRGDLVTNPAATSASASTGPGQVPITDCVDDSRFLIYVAATGAPVNDTPGGRRATTAVAGEAQGTWKIMSFAVRGVGTC